MAIAAPQQNVDNSTFYYQPQSIATYLGPTIVNPQGVPFCHSGLVCYTPQFIKSAYDFPSSRDGSGQTIVIVDAYGSPTIQNDLAAFDSEFGIAAPPSFAIICPPGGCPKTLTAGPHNPLSWAVETSLDVEYAHAMAPGANIVLVVAASSSGNAINVAEQAAIAAYPGSIMSQSFGIPEAAIHANNAQVLQAHLNYMAAQAAGITVLASAGDSGGSNGYAFPNALFPSSDPLVTAVGGTMGDPYVHGPIYGAGCQTSTCSAGLALYDNSTGACKGNGLSLVFTCPPAGYGGEQVWNEPGYAAATGGSPSLLFTAPSYQSSVMRTTPDVSYNAAINGGVLVYALGGVYIVGGTSAGSPQWAAIFALVNQARASESKGPIGFANPAIYALNGAGFHDITVGNDMLGGVLPGASAGPGYDVASGWGTPDVASIVTNLS